MFVQQVEMEEQYKSSSEVEVSALMVLVSDPANMVVVLYLVVVVLLLASLIQ